MHLNHSPLSFVLAAFTVLATAAPTAASNVLLTPQNFQQTISQGVWCVQSIRDTNPAE